MAQFLNIPSVISPPALRIRYALARWACGQFDLRNKRKTNRIIRYTHYWCMLKAWAGASSLIQTWQDQLPEILNFCECSRNTLIQALRWLHSEGWLHFDDSCIKMHSEKIVYAKCGLDYYKKVDRVFTKPEKIKDETTTHYWIYLADIDDNRKRQAYVVYQKIMQNPELKLWVYGLMQQYGYDIVKAEKDPMAVCALLFAVYRDSFHSKESEMYDWLVENRPDVNRGVRGMAKAWDTCPQNVSYIKKKMVQQGMAFVQKGGTIESHSNRHNKHCRVRWNKAKRMTFQAFCDDITARIHVSEGDRKRFSIPA